MSVLIKNMEMPKDCPMCPFAYWDFTEEFRGCKVVNGKKYAMDTEPGYPETNFRPSWCPLVPVPEHGRLIDADALCEGRVSNDNLWAGRVVATAPLGHVPDTEEPAWCPVREWQRKAEEAQSGDSKQV